MNLKNLFDPKSIAVVGASPDEGKIGNVIMKNLFEYAYAGEVFLVNPKYDEIFGQKCYRKLSDIEEGVDLAVLAIPAKFVNGEVESNAKKIKNYVVISAGFSETGEEGRKREDELGKIARDNSLNILGPNCLGFIVPSLKLNASFAGGMAKEGNISFISQSGALAVALLDIAKEKNLGFSNVISIGNKMDIDEAELLEFMASDEKTKVIGMYLESVKNGENFINVARKVSREKPIVILKAGKNEKTQKAISSHTGALAGSDEITSAVFKKTGILRAENLEEFFSFLNLVGSSREIESAGTAVITNAGGVGVLTSDVFGGKGVRLADLGVEVKRKLKNFLPEESSVENPIDLLGDAKEDRYQKTLEMISKIEDIGSVICLLTPQDQTPVEKIAEAIIDFKKKTGKIVATVFLGGERVRKAVGKLNREGVANFEFPDQAVNALDGYWRWKVSRENKIKPAEQIVNRKRKEKASGIIAKAKKENRGALYFQEAKELMDIYGVKTAACENILPQDVPTSVPTPVSTLPKAVFPAVLKVDSDKVLHKTDKKGLVLDIKNKTELKKALDGMRFDFPGERLIIQPMAEKGMEIIIGIKHDSVFGPVVLYGLGGIYAEYLHLVDYLVPPLNVREIEESLDRGKLGFLFRGARGQKSFDIEEISKVLMGVSLMAVENPEIREFDINPMIIYNNGKSSLAVDVKVII